MSDARPPEDEREDNGEISVHEASRLLDEIEGELDEIGRAIARITDTSPAGPDTDLTAGAADDEEAPGHLDEPGGVSGGYPGE